MTHTRAGAHKGPSTNADRQAVARRALGCLRKVASSCRLADIISRSRCGPHTRAGHREAGGRRRVLSGAKESCASKKGGTALQPNGCCSVTGGRWIHRHRPPPAHTPHSGCGVVLCCAGQGGDVWFPSCNTEAPLWSQSWGSLARLCAGWVSACCVAGGGGAFRPGGLRQTRAGGAWRTGRW
jgi:hypothetical protein